jgi:hypothetical protein
VHYLRKCCDAVGDGEGATWAAERERVLKEEHPWVVDEEPYLEAFSATARDKGVHILEYRGDGLQPCYFLDVCHPSPVFTERIADDLSDWIIRRAGEENGDTLNGDNAGEAA